MNAHAYSRSVLILAFHHWSEAKDVVASVVRSHSVRLRAMCSLSACTKTSSASLARDSEAVKSTVS